MKEQIEKVLNNLMKSFGPEIFKNPNRFRGAILDEQIDKHQKKVRFLLCLAICDMRVFTRLLSINISTLAEEMHTEYEINKDAARIVVQAIARLHNLEEKFEPYDKKYTKKEDTVNEPIKDTPTAVKPPLPEKEDIKETKTIAVEEKIPIIKEESKEHNIKQPHAKILKNPEPQKITIKPYKVGDILHFGEYNWRILKLEENGTTTIICNEIVSKMAYHNRKIGITWERSDIRKYLNNTFYGKFSISQQRAIISTEINNPFNEKYFTHGGLSTIDRVFLLSIDEAKNYFANDTDRIAKQGKEATWWWLRSPGSHPDHAAFVYNGGSISLDGEVSVYTYGNQYGMRFIGYRVGGVRPVVVINLALAL